MHDWKKMKKIIILIPVFNDWESLIKLLEEIDINIKGIKDFLFECYVINDASTIDQPKINKPENINSLKILNMRINKGHARCNAFGIRYLTKNERFDYLILMDGDGEDRPVELKSLINKIGLFPDKSVVAKRIKRSEGYFFKFLYVMHKALTYLFTGKNINFGNYSCLIKQDADKISSLPSLWSSYSGTIKKNFKNLNEINSIRGLRYFGPSKMSLFKLLIHSFSIIAVFKYHVVLRSIFLLILLSLLEIYLGQISFFVQILIVIFNIIIFLVSLREKKDDLLTSHENLKDIEEITHEKVEN